jgi:quinol monooxygenase YgiN
MLPNTVLRRMNMINVIASIRVKNGKIPEFLSIFKANVPKVRAEKGCIEYLPTVDIDSKLPPQEFDQNVVTIIEKWESLDALRDHLKTPHMREYGSAVKNIVEGLSLKVLTEA